MRSCDWSSDVFSSDLTVLEAVRRMADAHVGALMGIRDGQLVGIISERDYARKVILKNRSSATTMVRDIMSAPVITVQPNSSINQCMQLMTNQRVRHLPVLDVDAVIGIVSIGDLIRAMIEDQQVEIAQLQQYIAKIGR